MKSKGHVADSVNRWTYCQCGEVAATPGLETFFGSYECHVANKSDGMGYGDGVEKSTPIECLIAYVLQGIS